VRETIEDARCRVNSFSTRLYKGCKPPRGFNFEYSGRE